LAHRPCVFALAPELTVKSRRRELEVIRGLDESRHIEHVPGFPARGLAVADADAAGLVHEEAEHPASALPVPLRVNQTEPPRGQHRGDRRLDSAEPGPARVRVHPCFPQKKKWAAPTLP